MKKVGAKVFTPASVRGFFEGLDGVDGVGSRVIDEVGARDIECVGADASSVVGAAPVGGDGGVETVKSIDGVKGA